MLIGSLVPLEPLWLLSTLILLLGALGLALWTEHRRLATILILFGFLIFGSFRFLQSVHPSGHFHLAKVDSTVLGQKVELEGVIVSPPEGFPPRGGWRKEERVRFLMQVDRMTLEGFRYATTGIARLSIIAPLEEYQYGHRIRGHFRIRRPRGYWNPGAFNYRRYALTKGFYLEGWGRDRGKIQILDRTGGFWILRGVFDLRETMISRMHAALPHEEGGMLRSIVLGDRSGLSPKTRDVFLNSGTYHILVISGLHLG
ncbi:MAG: ComEC/Rec2 family competence protein, partial [Candidatus Methylomirabilales bacterium]